MIIGFDAKRAFFNRAGLGNYSRDAVSLLSRYYPENEYYLYSPNPGKSRPFITADNVKIKGPDSFAGKLLPSLWRRKMLPKQLVADKVSLYHGISNELPVGIEKTGIPSIVSIADLIFLRYPQLYYFQDRRVYKYKFRQAAEKSNRIIAISEQTKADIVSYFSIPAEKIDVVYLCCNPLFYDAVSDIRKAEITKKFNLPKDYILYVSTIEPRKNLLNIIKAIHTGNIDIPVVVVGRQTEYAETVKKYVSDNNVKNVNFLKNVSNEELPAIYQKSSVFVYPSTFEGFGIPILEALNSKVPVITSKGGCFSEVGGKSSMYVNPEDIDELSAAIKKVLSDQGLRKQMIDDGIRYAANFMPQRIAEGLMNVYRKVLK